MLVLTGRRNSFEFRPFGESGCEHRLELHRFRDLRHRIDVGGGKWTLCHHNRGNILVANDDDMLPRIGDSYIHERRRRQRRQSQYLCRLSFIVPAGHRKNAIRSQVSQKRQPSFLGIESILREHVRARGRSGPRIDE